MGGCLTELQINFSVFALASFFVSQGALEDGASTNFCRHYTPRTFGADVGGLCTRMGLVKPAVPLGSFQQMWLRLRQRLTNTPVATTTCFCCTLESAWIMSCLKNRSALRSGFTTTPKQFDTLARRAKVWKRLCGRLEKNVLLVSNSASEQLLWKAHNIKKKLWKP